MQPEEFLINNENFAVTDAASEDELYELVSHIAVPVLLINGGIDCLLYTSLAELSILQTDINEYVLQSLATFITEGVTDQSWNAYVERIDAMGLDRLMEIYTEGYNSVA